MIDLVLMANNILRAHADVIAGKTVKSIGIELGENNVMLNNFRTHITNSNGKKILVYVYYCYTPGNQPTLDSPGSYPEISNVMLAYKNGIDCSSYLDNPEIDYFIMEKCWDDVIKNRKSKGKQNAQ